MPASCAIRGCFFDFVDDDRNVDETWIAGKRAYEKP
jgi:hypothetical protein